MKKFILGLIAGGILFIPAGVKAWAFDIRPPRPQPIYQFNCWDANNNEEHRCTNEIAVFDDKNNKCYVSYDRFGAQSSISCIKE